MNRLRRVDFQFFDEYAWWFLAASEGAAEPVIARDTLNMIHIRDILDSAHDRDTLDSQHVRDKLDLEVM